MKSDSLQQYVPRLESILKEKAELEERLGEIDQILQSLRSKESSSSPPSSGGGGKKAGPSAKVSKKAGVRTRAQNKLSLREAVRQATTRKPLTKAEILEAIGKLGYKFSTSNPLNSLSSVLYGDKKEFQNVGGRFSPIKASGSFSSSAAPASVRAKKSPASAKVSKKLGAQTRSQNKMSLREAVQQATARKPLTKAEILEAIDKLGYKFSTSKPANSLNSVLYGDKEFQNVGGRFSPIKASGSFSSSAAPASVRAKKSPASAKVSKKAGVRTRAQNKMSLREAVRQATARKPLTKAEILEAIGKLGYKFNTSDPVNSLNGVLYDTKKKEFKNFDGRFGLV